MWGVQLAEFQWRLSNFGFLFGRPSFIYAIKLRFLLFMEHFKGRSKWVPVVFTVRFAVMITGTHFDLLLGYSMGRIRIWIRDQVVLFHICVQKCYDSLVLEYNELHTMLLVSMFFLFTCNVTQASTPDNEINDARRLFIILYQFWPLLPFLTKKTFGHCSASFISRVDYLVI